jgi:hypothetical protein
MPGEPRAKISSAPRGAVLGPWAWVHDTGAAVLTRCGYNLRLKRWLDEVRASERELASSIARAAQHRAEKPGIVFPVPGRTAGGVGGPGCARGAVGHIICVRVINRVLSHPDGTRRRGAMC